MKDPLNKVIMKRTYLFFLFIHGIIEMVTFSTAKSQDHVFRVPPVSLGLLCYSNCATCPFICSPPPAPPVMPTTSPRHLPPVKPYYIDQPPPFPRINPSPPEPYYYDQPPPLPPISLSPPEPYYFDQPAPLLPAFPTPSTYVPWSENPYVVSPPAPANNFAGQGPPGTMQQRSFTFPYYYSNISQGCISFRLSFLVHVIVCLAMFLSF